MQKLRAKQIYKISALHGASFISYQNKKVRTSAPFYYLTIPLMNLGQVCISDEKR